MSNLTDAQRACLIKAMKAEGISSGTILEVIDRVEATFPAGTPAPRTEGRSVTVVQTADTVEAGSTMTGLVIKGDL